jgi:hypothetical protein
MGRRVAESQPKSTPSEGTRRCGARSKIPSERGSRCKGLLRFLELTRVEEAESRRRLGVPVFDRTNMRLKIALGNA